MSGLQQHVDAPLARGHRPSDGFAGAAGGVACGDLVRVSVALGDGQIQDAGFDAAGCAAAVAAGSAAVALVRGRPLLAAARLSATEIEAELGGLLPTTRHAAELAADALHRALGAAARHADPLRQRADRTLVAMSGGVDSAVAALLSARAGADPVAVTLELWADPDNDGERSCCSAQAVRGARALAHRMGIPHLTLDLREEFRAGVVEPFVADHAAGLTPNPCVRCNGHVRLDAMLDLADRVGASTLTTGHYARTTAEPGADAPVDAPVLLTAARDGAKDQSYMLAATSPVTLGRLRFPLGALTKPEVRALAAEAGLPVAGTRDSQDLCFLAGTDRAAFLARHGGVRERPGDIVDQRGRVLGRHHGHHGFTVGQRKGLGVAAPEPLYVLETDAPSNRVVAGPRPSLRRTRVHVRGAILHRDGAAVDRVKLRYRSRPLAARIDGPAPAGRHEALELRLAEAVEGAAPGQTACLMSGEVIVGHATIAAAQ